MLTHSTRRWLAGLGVAGAFVAASASPAVAQETKPQLSIYFGDNTIATDTTGKIDGTILYSTAPVVLQGVTVRYDYRDLAGKATLTEEGESADDCTSPEKGILVCTERFEVGIEDGWGLGGLAPVVIAPTDAAKEGDVGALKVTLSADGFDAVSHEAKVRVGEGVDLAGADPIAVSGRPGAKISAPLKVSNAGETPAKGVSVVFFNDYGIQADKRYSNCTYVDNSLRSCTFDQELAKGASYSTPLEYRIAKDAYAPGFEYGEHNWMTIAEYEDFRSYLETNGFSLGKPGDGDVLTLSEAGKSARGVQADKNPDNNWSHVEVTVTGKNGTDLAAIGDDVKGAAGAKVTATVGFRNNGPATLDYTRGNSSVTHMTVGIPTGVTVVEAPETCAPVEGDQYGELGEAGGRQYRCIPSPFIKAGDEEKVTFGLRIDKVIPDAAGTVKVNVPCECDGGFYADLKPANDTAKILVNATGGDGGQGGGDDDGGLPVTGQSTGLIAGLGALLLAAGVGGYLVAKRRRTRFVA
ncbi:LPXTG cell wall anchor domain-containing protein [Micromonospora sp. CV4]|uniref:LPXTG cell wall anchor domain-containing protein n=1 Tax=Micromonospora sp. CV4 TaxID=2478711 RepID=UPI000EF46CEF|nr:LPXTG cell wall anchor domain-containing protein [Micromonospora sp. CV4]RLP89254.1 LPXTG cell wall anchor domain-containing protein [Micromonospora sp. CV4]